MQLTRCYSLLSALPRNIDLRRRVSSCSLNLLQARTGNGSGSDIADRASPPYTILFAGSDNFSCESLKVLAEATSNEPGPSRMTTAGTEI